MLRLTTFLCRCNMKATLTSDNYRDFNQRYAQSYGYFIKSNGERLPVYMTDVNESAAYFQNLDGVEFSANCNSGVEFEFTQIARRIWLGFDGNLYCTSRVPRRQWQRGISNGNTSCYKLTKKGPVGIDITHNVMKNLMFNQGVNVIGNNILLSEQFAICGEIVYLYTMCIGSYKPENKAIILDEKYKMFMQEISDAAKQFGIGVLNA